MRKGAYFEKTTLRQNSSVALEVFAGNCCVAVDSIPRVGVVSGHSSLFGTIVCDSVDSAKQEPEVTLGPWCRSPMRQALDEEEEWEDVTATHAAKVPTKVKSGAATAAPASRPEHTIDTGTAQDVGREASASPSRKSAGPSTPPETGSAGAQEDGTRQVEAIVPNTETESEPVLFKGRIALDGSNAQALYQEAERLSKTVFEREQQVREQRKRLRDLERALEGERARAATLSLQLREQEERAREDKARLQAEQARWKQLEQQRKLCEQEHVHRSVLQALEAKLKARDDQRDAEHQAAIERLVTEAKDELETAKNEYRNKLRILQSQLHHVREMLERTQDEATKRERQRQEELDQARQRIAELEEQNQELSRGIPEATRPLLRQIQQLQEQLRERRVDGISTREQLERQRAQAESAVAEANRARACLAEEVARLRARIQELESTGQALVAECDCLRDEKTAAVLALTEARAHCQQLEEAARKANDEWTHKIARLEAEAAAKQRTLEDSLERMQREQSDLHQKLEERERERLQLRAALDASLTAPSSLEKMSSSVPEPLKTRPTGEQTNPYGTVAHELTPSLEESLFSNKIPNAVLWTQMQSLLRRRTNQIRTLQTELTEREASITNLTREISTLTQRLDADMVHAGELENRIRQMEERERALLELLGEREERLQELGNDIADMKAIYREQLQELADQLEMARAIKERCAS